MTLDATYCDVQHDLWVGRNILKVERQFMDWQKHLKSRTARLVLRLTYVTNLQVNSIDIMMMYL